MSARACPFVAFTDDSARRSASPADEHGCFAQRPPLAIDLGHQARFCLGGEFAACPAFAAWASREAAKSVDAAPVPVTLEERLAASGATGQGIDLEAIARGEEVPLASAEPVDEVYGGSDPEGSIWAAVPVPPPPPTGAADRERERIIPLHRRRDVEDELPKPPIRLPKAIGGARGVAAIILCAAVALFAAPSIFKGIGGFVAAIAATPTPSVTATPTPSATATPTPTPPAVYHTVVFGDTMSKISTLYQVSIDAILGANPSITDPAKIYVGQRILIPSVIPDVTASPSP